MFKDDILYESLRTYFDTSSEYRREVACFWTKETGILSMTTNNSAGVVEFNWFEVWCGIKPLYPRPECSVMMHSHPPGCDNMSGIDYNMVYGWVTALGMPIYYVIVLPTHYHGYICSKPSKDQMEIEDLGLIPHGEASASHQLVCYVLQGLSNQPFFVEEDELKDAKTVLNQKELITCLPQSSMASSITEPSIPIG